MSHGITYIRIEVRRRGQGAAVAEYRGEQQIEQLLGEEENLGSYVRQLGDVDELTRLERIDRLLVLAAREFHAEHPNDVQAYVERAMAAWCTVDERHVVPTVEVETHRVDPESPDEPS